MATKTNDVCRTTNCRAYSNIDVLLLQTTSDQNVVQHHIPVLHSVLPSVTLPNVVSGIQPVPVNNAVSQYPLTMLTSPTYPLPVGPYICLPPPAHIPMHQDVVSATGINQTSSCQVVMPEHYSSHDSGRLIYEGERVPDMRVDEPLQERGRWSPDRLHEILYRDKILDDDMSRERLEKRLMREKIEQWKIRDGVDSDRVEFERLRTPHRNVIEAGMHCICSSYEFMK